MSHAARSGVGSSRTIPGSPTPAETTTPAYRARLSTPSAIVIFGVFRGTSAVGFSTRRNASARLTASATTAATYSPAPAPNTAAGVHPHDSNSVASAYSTAKASTLSARPSATRSTVTSSIALRNAGSLSYSSGDSSLDVPGSSKPTRGLVAGVATPVTPSRSLATASARSRTRPRRAARIPVRPACVV